MLGIFVLDTCCHIFVLFVQMAGVASSLIVLVTILKLGTLFQELPKVRLRYDLPVFTVFMMLYRFSGISDHIPDYSCCFRPSYQQLCL